MPEIARLSWNSDWIDLDRDWVHKADLQPTSEKTPNQVAVDETVIRIDDQQYWLYAAADPQTNELFHRSCEEDC